MNHTRQIAACKHTLINKTRITVIFYIIKNYHNGKIVLNGYVK